MTKTATTFRVVEAWKRSGMGQQQYAARIGLAYSTLQFWIRKHREQHTHTALQRVAEFVPNRVAESDAVFRRALCCPHYQRELLLWTGPIEIDTSASQYLCNKMKGDDDERTAQGI